MTLADMQSLHSLILLWLIGTTAGYLLPSPLGKYNVTLETGPIVDYTRSEPNTATPTPRELMLSVFQPATCASTVQVPYMPSKTAEYQGPALQEIFSIFNFTTNLSPLFLDARLPVCPEDPGCSTLEDAPILLFSSGYSIPRLYYNFLASAIASEGFTVITIDHPGDANIITYPDGHTVYNNSPNISSPTIDDFIEATNVRAVDASFIIDQLSNATAMSSLFPNRRHRPLPTDQIAMFGHSAGGAAAIVAASRDSRIRGAINWDGSIFGSPDLPGLSQPVMFMTHDNTTSPDWLEAYSQLEGPKVIAHIDGTTHYTFSDVLTLLQAAKQSAAPFADLLGTIAPAEMVRILTAYTAAWMEGVFKGNEEEPLLQRLENHKFPEVEVFLKDNF